MAFTNAEKQRRWRVRRTAEIERLRALTGSPPTTPTGTVTWRQSGPDRWITTSHLTDGVPDFVIVREEHTERLRGGKRKTSDFFQVIALKPEDRTSYLGGGGTLVYAQDVVQGHVNPEYFADEIEAATAD